MPPVAMMPACDAAEHRGDAGEVRGGQEGQADERGEALPGDDALAVGEQAAAEPGDERRDREADHLDEDDVDADARGRALVGPHREHRRAERARAQQGHAHGHDDADDQAHEAERQAGEVLADADAEVDAEQLRASRPWRRTDSTRSVLRNQIASMPNASASVTTPSVRPRRRSAGRPDEHADDRRGARRRAAARSGTGRPSRPRGSSA